MISTSHCIAASIVAIALIAPPRLALTQNTHALSPCDRASNWMFSAATRGASRRDSEVEKIPAEGHAGARLLGVAPEECAEFLSCP